MPAWGGPAGLTRVPRPPARTERHLPTHPPSRPHAARHPIQQPRPVRVKACCWLVARRGSALLRRLRRAGDPLPLEPSAWLAGAAPPCAVLCAPPCPPLAIPQAGLGVPRRLHTSDRDSARQTSRRGCCTRTHALAARLGCPRPRRRALESRALAPPAPWRPKPESLRVLRCRVTPRALPPRPPGSPPMRAAGRPGQSGCARG